MSKTRHVFFITRRGLEKRHCLLVTTVPAVKKDYTFWMFIQGVRMNTHRGANRRCDFRCDFWCDLTRIIQS